MTEQHTDDIDDLDAVESDVDEDDLDVTAPNPYVDADPKTPQDDMEAPGA